MQFICKFGLAGVFCLMGAVDCFGEQLSHGKAVVVASVVQTEVKDMTQGFVDEGLKYYKGVEGFERDDVRAFELFEKAAQGGNAEGMYWSSMCYYKGRGIGKNGKQSYKWLELAIDKKHTGAMNLLGTMMFDTVEGVPFDYKRATRLFKRASDLGDPYGTVNYGMAVTKGRGTKKNEMKGLAIIEEAEKYKGDDFAHGYGYYRFAQYHRFGGWNNGTDMKKAREYYLKSIERGNLFGLHIYGYTLINELYSDVDSSEQVELGVELLERAIKKGNGSACETLGDFYTEYHSEKYDRDLVKARALYKQGSDLGHAESGVLYSLMCERGEGGEPDYTEAFVYAVKAADAGEEQGYSRAGAVYVRHHKMIKGKEHLESFLRCMSLGSLYGMSQEKEWRNDWRSEYVKGSAFELGLGVEKNINRGLRHLNIASKKRVGAASYRLGKIYEHGLGVKKDWPSAYDYYHKGTKDNDKDESDYDLAACELRVARSLLFQGAKEKMITHGHEHLGFVDNYDMNKEVERGYRKLWGRVYYYGLGKDKDWREAIEYFQASSNMGDINSASFIAYIYMYGENEGLQDFEKGVKWAKIGAQRGNGACMNYLGEWYLKGFGVGVDYFKAREYFEKAIDVGEKSALFKLAMIYYNGQGVEKNFDKAYALVKKSYDAKQLAGYRYMGYMHERGEGVKRDYGKAMLYYVEGGKKGNPLCLLSAGNLYEKGLGVKIDYRRARELYLKSAKQKRGEAMFALSLLYEKGLGVEVDMKASKDWLIKSDLAGYKKATEKLDELEIAEELKKLEGEN